MEKKSYDYYYVADSISYAPTREQLFGSRVHVTGAEEYTGMLLCPQRLAHIAAMRCGMYQEQFGCGSGCVNAAGKLEIDAVTAAAQETVESGEMTTRRRFASRNKKHVLDSRARALCGCGHSMRVHSLEDGRCLFRGCSCGV